MLIKSINEYFKVFDEWNLTNKEIWDVIYEDKDKMDFTSMNIYMSKLAILAKSQDKNHTNEFRKSLGLSIDDMLIN